MARRPNPDAQAPGAPSQKGRPGKPPTGDNPTLGRSSSETPTIHGSETEAQDTSAAGSRQGSPRTTGRQTSPAELLRSILEGYLHSSSLQADYQNLYRTLPSIVGVAGEILKRKEAGDAALQEGVKAVENVLEDARDKAEQLSKVMAEQQKALESLLHNKTSLTDLLRASQGKGGESGVNFPQISPDVSALADPKVAYQLNTLMGNINSMVSREVERQIAGLRAQAEKTLQQAQKSR